MDYIYEIPVELAKEVVGHRHDEDVSEDEKRWEMLAWDNKGNPASRIFQVSGICLFVFYLIKYFYTKLHN